MSRRRYLWRVRAYYPVSETVTRVVQRHYQTEAAARYRAAVLVGAVEPVNGGQWVEERPESVTIERSAPVDGWTAAP